ncbi:4Fe-4S dicluster domain-containing protein [Chloroflexota bacterium]
MTKVLSKKALLSWLGNLIKEQTIIAPTRVDELILFRPIKDTDNIVLDFHNTAISPKEYFFPETDVLFTIDNKNGASELQLPGVTPGTVIFGIRPCDAKGIRLLDFPLLEEPADTAYAERRLKTTLVGLACIQAEPQCFCTSIGSGPDTSEDLDILLTPVDDVYIVEAITEKGEALLATAVLDESDITPPPPPSLVILPVEGVSVAIREAFEDPYWDRLADRCLHCNTCSYVCPTCYCFDIRDSWSKGTIERLRTWESCQSPGFRRIAGGHDPRLAKGSKLRQRFAHKLLYFPEQFGAFGCVGCGRCLNACPVNIDIREVINDVNKEGGRVGYAKA